MDELLNIAGRVGPGGLLTVIVLMVLTDRLIPRSRYLEMKADRDEYRKAFNASNEANLIQARTTIEHLEIARRNDHFISSIPGLSGREANDVEPDAQA
jgi:hypothetical protein